MARQLPLLQERAASFQFAVTDKQIDELVAEKIGQPATVNGPAATLDEVTLKKTREGWKVAALPANLDEMVNTVGVAIAALVPRLKGHEFRTAHEAVDFYHAQLTRARAAATQADSQPMGK